MKPDIPRKSPRIGLLAISALALAGCAPDGGGPEPGTAYVEDCVAQERPLGRTAIALEPVFGNLSFQAPIALVQAPGDTDRYHVAERAGRVLAVDAPPGGAAAAETVLDIRDRVRTQGEGGLLGLAFHPGYPDTPHAFVSYTAPGSPLVSRLSRFTVAADGRFTGEEILLSLDQPYSNHNGGWIGFGPDGHLYFGLGDGGSGGDPLNHAQNTGTLFGALLRLDVDSPPHPGKAYAVPDDNPFAPGGARPGAGLPEIYAWGLRNPWRWSFDRATGDLWLGDVGQNAWEEIDRIESGGNYGWRCYEGTHAYDTGGCADAGAYVAPLAEYPHGDECSVTGGYVYRGGTLGDLAGVYLFGDFCSGRIWGLAGGSGAPEELLDTPYSIGSFAQDNAGEVYVLHLGSPGGIYRIVPGSGGGGVLEPDSLSETGCAAAGDPAQPAAGMTAYSVNAPFWSDAAQKSRWLSLPAGAAVDIEADLDWTLPAGAVLRKDFRLDGRLVETRLYMRHTDGEWAGYSFRWNDAGTDATLLGGAEDVAYGAWTWHFPSPNECAACHTAAAGRSLGLETAQLNGPGAVGGNNQLTALAQAGLFSAPLPDTPGNLPRLTDPYGGGPLAERARSYLHTNCAPCHRPGGPTPVGGMDLRYATSLADMGICDAPPQAGDLGIVDARLLAPGEPARSVLVARMDRRDAPGMPPLASHLVDVEGVGLISDWIAGTTACL